MKKSNFILLLSLATFFSCKKTGPEGPQGPQGPQGTSGNSTVKGNFIGYVNFYDANGNKLKSDTTTTVSIGGNTITSKADTAGRYFLKDVPQGNYNIYTGNSAFAKGGLINQNISGSYSAYLQTISVSKTPTMQLVIASPTVNTSINLGFVSSDAVIGVNRKVAIFAGDNSSVSNTSYKYLITSFMPAGVSSTSISISPTLLTSNGFTSGQSIFFKLYPLANQGLNASYYQDTLTGKLIYNAVNLAGITTASCIIP